jgi:hypothetical protein
VDDKVCKEEAVMKVLHALSGLLQHFLEDFKVMDILKLWAPLGTELACTSACTASMPEGGGSHTLAILYGLAFRSLFIKCSRVTVSASDHPYTARQLSMLGLVQRLGSLQGSAGWTDKLLINCTDKTGGYQTFTPRRVHVPQMRCWKHCVAAGRRCCTPCRPSSGLGTPWRPRWPRGQLSCTACSAH